MDVIQKIWGYCSILKHDGINNGDYIEQLTYLLILKLAEEKAIITLPASFDWPALRDRSGTDLLDYYHLTLRELGKQHALLGDLFAGALSRFRESVTLKRLINLIDEIEWAALDLDLKGTIYGGLLQNMLLNKKAPGNISLRAY